LVVSLWWAEAGASVGSTIPPPTGQHPPVNPHAAASRLLWTIEPRTTALAVVHAQYLGVPASLTPSSPCTSVPRRVTNTVTDAALLERAHGARNGRKFAALWRGDTSNYPSHSEADLALCAMLAFWTRGDAARIDGLFRASGLMRPKWDAARGGQTYGAQTIASALGGQR
jgi:hypothetical protein